MAASDAPPVVDEDDAPTPIKQRTQPHLMPQDAKTVDASKLTALTPEVVRFAWKLGLTGSPTYFLFHSWDRFCLGDNFMTISTLSRSHQSQRINPLTLTLPSPTPPDPPAN